MKQFLCKMIPVIIFLFVFGLIILILCIFEKGSIIYAITLGAVSSLMVTLYYEVSSKIRNRKKYKRLRSLVLSEIKKKFLTLIGVINADAREYKLISREYNNVYQIIENLYNMIDEISKENKIIPKSHFSFTLSECSNVIEAIERINENRAYYIYEEIISEEDGNHLNNIKDICYTIMMSIMNDSKQIPRGKMACEDVKNRVSKVISEFDIIKDINNLKLGVNNSYGYGLCFDKNAYLNYKRDMVKD